MKALIPIFICVLFASGNIQSQTINQQNITDKYWVENMELSTDGIYLFEAQDSFSKNQNVPYTLNAFRLSSNSSGTFYDWNFCHSTTADDKSDGSWKINSDNLIITTSLCEKRFKIIALSEKQLKLKIIL